MNRAELIDSIPLGTTSKAEAGRIVDRVLNALHMALARGEEVRLHGFGNFSITERPAGEGRNPRTGEKMQIAAKRTVKFRAASVLRDAVNAKR